jgi:hypothetical protein
MDGWCVCVWVSIYRVYYNIFHVVFKYLELDYIDLYKDIFHILLMRQLKQIDHKHPVNEQKINTSIHKAIIKLHFEH